MHTSQLLFLVFVGLPGLLINVAASSGGVDPAVSQKHDNTQIGLHQTESAAASRVLTSKETDAKYFETIGVPLYRSEGEEDHEEEKDKLVATSDIKFYDDEDVGVGPPNCCKWGHLWVRGSCRKYCLCWAYASQSCAVCRGSAGVDCRGKPKPGGSTRSQPSSRSSGRGRSGRKSL